MAYLLTQLPAGVLSDRFGTKPILIVGYGLCGIAGLLFFFAQSASPIYAGRVIQGVGEAPIWALGPALLSLAYPNAKGRAIGIYNAAIHAGLTLGPLLGLFVAPSGQSGVPFLLFAALCFIGGGIVLVFLPRVLRSERSQVETRATGRQLIRLLVNKRSSMILISVVLYGACYGAFVSVLPISLVVLNEFTAQATSIFFVVFYASISGAQLVAGPLSDCYGRKGFMVGGLLLAAIGLGTFPSFPGLWVFFPLSVASVGLGIFCVTSLAELNESVSPSLKGTVSGSYYLAWGLGYALGPLGIGYLSVVAPALGYYALSAALGVHALAMQIRRE